MNTTLTTSDRARIARQYGIATSSVDAEFVANITAEHASAVAAYAARKPAMRAQAQAAYDAAFAKGGNNAGRRAIRAARAILPDFTA
jgi:hypothetical protein